MDEIHGQASMQDSRRRRKSLQHTCKVCGRKFYGWKDITGKHGSTIRRIAKYCSKKCWSVRSTIYVKCRYCGKQIRTTKSVNKKYCSKDCRNKGYVGKKHTKEHCKKISESLKGKIPKNAWRSGELHPMWNPDRTDQRERFTNKYRDWRYAVIKRDKWTCQICGDKRSSGKNFCVDHIKPFSTYPELRYEISNGRVLCNECHRKTDTYCRKRYAKFIGKEEQWETITQKI